MRKHTILRNILIDLVCAGLALVVFALFHHVLPRQQQSLGIVITNPYLNESPEGDAGGSLPEALGLTASAGVSDTPVLSAKGSRKNRNQGDGGNGRL